MGSKWDSKWAAEDPDWWVENAEEYNRKVVLYPEFWRDFIGMQMRKHGNESRVEDFISKSPEEAINEIMRKGSVDLGGKSKAVKCPSVSGNPAICGLAPFPHDDVDGLVCSGPTVEKEKGGIIRSKRKVYKERRCRSRCPYNVFEKLDIEEIIPVVHRRLVDHPEYETVNLQEEYQRMYE